MSSALLTFLKYIFLAALYLFFLRVLRAVWSELRDPETAGGPGPGAEAGVPVAPPARAPLRPEPIGRLVVLDPPAGAGQVYPLGAEITIGRAPGCAVSLPDDTFVSQMHARVFHRENDFFVEDLGSTNGTFLNGQKVGAPVALRVGDRLQIGNTTLGLRP
jgi:FHA domain